MPAMKRRILILDAMGVIYHHADDVVELLTPFIVEHGGVDDVQIVDQLYTQASLGKLTAEEFWAAVKVQHNLEDEYLAQHRLTEGLIKFLENLPPAVETLWCLSNDVSQWSRKLRQWHSLTKHFAGFVISGDVGHRKPDARIYEATLQKIGRPAVECVFVDDRIKNLDAAKRLGFQTVQFCPTADHTKHFRVKSFGELRTYLSA
jgi:HAD superfamily hydrolase (TIGR01509 family)